MIKIDVKLGDRSYPVVIEAGLLANAAHWLVPLARGRTMVIVTDSNLRHHRHVLERGLTAAGVATAVIELPPGEGTKSWAMLEKLTDDLLDLGVERGDHVIALGGGVIGDLV
ncbi:MAG: 3-dehydroquinate synthase, partial [Sphingomonas sp. 12-62-6]